MRLWEGLINVERPPLMGQCPVCQRGPEWGTWARSPPLPQISSGSNVLFAVDQDITDQHPTHTRETLKWVEMYYRKNWVQRVRVLSQGWWLIGGLGTWSLQKEPTGLRRDFTGKDHAEHVPALSFSGGGHPQRLS
jgi:hypothetical protein